MASRTKDAPEKNTRSLLKTVLLFILHQWLLLGMGVACLLAYFFPSVASHGGIIRAEYTILYAAVAIIFLVSGLSIPRDKLLTHVRNWRLHLLVQGFSYLFVPALMVALVQLIHATDNKGNIDDAILAGFTLLSCLPTTISSNVVMTRAAGGDEAAALVEVLVANIMGPFVTPGWTVTLLPKDRVFDPWRDGADGNLTEMYREVFQELGLTVLLPLIVGQVVRWTFPERTAWAVQRFYLGKISTACLILLVWCSFSTCFSTDALSSLSTPSILLTVFLNVALYLTFTVLCFTLCRPPKRLRTNRRFLRHILPPIPPGETIAICFCGPAKTTGLGIPLLYAMYKGGDMARNAKTSVPVILYTTEQIFCAHFMVRLFRRWLRRMEGKAGDRDREAGTAPEGEAASVDENDSPGAVEPMSVEQQPVMTGAELAGKGPVWTEPK
ncbi:hypothetical protein VTO42DRAFT_3101 [Malbranchea cinnamomea]